MLLASLIIVFREVLEAGIITGIVLAATRGMKGRSLFVGGGIAVGVAGACIVAAFARFIAAAFAGDGQELFNAGVLGLAVLMLGWHTIWMAHHGRALAAQAGDLGRAIVAGTRPLYALAVVIGIAVLREGSEVVLFLYGVAVSSNEPTSHILAGSALGLLAGVAVTCVIYFGLVRIPMKHLFKVTGALIMFLAAGLGSQATAFLAQGGVLRIGQRPLWNTSFILGDNTMLGKALHVLFGYTARPTEAQLIVYLAILFVLWAASRAVTNGFAGRQKTLVSV
jgi:high-affinity iron transporter